MFYGIDEPACQFVTIRQNGIFFDYHYPIKIKR